MEVQGVPKSITKEVDGPPYPLIERTIHVIWGYIMCSEPRGELAFPNIRPMNQHYQEFRQLLNRRRNMPGDIVEFGAAYGGSTRILAFSGRRVWALDTFDGVPKEDLSEIDNRSKAGELGLEGVTLEGLFGAYENVTPLKGRIAETVELIPEDRRFALAYVDCNLYKSGRQAYEWLLRGNKMLPGGCIVVDDYTTCDGMRRATDEFLEETKWPSRPGFERPDGLIIEIPNT